MLNSALAIGRHSHPNSTYVITSDITETLETPGIIHSEIPNSPYSRRIRYSDDHESTSDAKPLPLNYTLILFRTPDSLLRFFLPSLVTIFRVKSNIHLTA